MSAADNRAGDEAPPRIGLHAAWAARGFAAAVVPIIPPGAPLAPGSVIAPDKLGKLPGRRGGDGLCLLYTSPSPRDS